MEAANPELGVAAPCKAKAASLGQVSKSVLPSSRGKHARCSEIAHISKHSTCEIFSSTSGDHYTGAALCASFFDLAVNGWVKLKESYHGCVPYCNVERRSLGIRATDHHVPPHCSFCRGKSCRNWLSS